MATKTQTATNGKATAEDVAQSIEPIYIHDALGRRVADRIKDLEDARAAVNDAGAALDDVIDLAREMTNPPADTILRDMPGGRFAFVPKRQAPAAPDPAA